MNFVMEMYEILFNRILDMDVILPISGSHAK